MEGQTEGRQALAVFAATAGMGLASGRAPALFFAQTGRASWVGVAAASAVFGALMGLVCAWAGRCGVGSFAALCRRALGPRVGRVARILYGLVMGLAAAVMLLGAGEVGALTLPMDNGRLWGTVLALVAAALLCAFRFGGQRWAGIITLVAGVAFYGACALDPRPVRAHLRGEVALALSGSVPAALLLAATYGALCACLAADAAARAGGNVKQPARFGLLCGAMLAAPLACANAAILRGGEALCAQRLPAVLLSARWGIAGFWLCAALGFLCAVSTLAAAMLALVGRGKGK